MSAGKVLVVDDEPQIRRIMRTTLTSAGYEVDDAKTGEEALEKVRGFRPDLVLLDINMPVMDGYTAAKTLRQEQPPGTKLVLIAHSANSSPSDVQRAIEGGFDRHVSKPITGGTLFGLIEAYLVQSTADVTPAGRESPQRRDDPGFAPGDAAEKPGRPGDGEQFSS